MIELGSARQLFIDDHVISVRSGIKRKLHQAKKREAVLKGERPWEGARTYCFGSVIQDAESGNYTMWYLARLGGGNEVRSPGLNRQGDIVCVATSEDGLNWTKPSLGLVSFDGSKDNNIVMINGHCPSVLFDSDAPETERYRMAVNGWGRERGYTLRHSPDGLNWSFYNESPMFSENTQNEVMCLARDPRTKRFFAYHRRWADNYKPSRRVIAVSWSDDFRHWSPARLIITPDELDLRSDFSEPFGTEFYNMSGFWYESQFIGFLPVFLVESYTPNAGADGSNKSGWEGPIDAQLTHSRNGLEWRRFEDRTPIIPRGESGSFDAGCILGCANSPVIHDEEVRLYYTGVSTTHGGSMPLKTVSIGAAQWRRDGFVSMNAGDITAMVETVPLRMNGTMLYINADASQGLVSVEIVTMDGKIRDGFGCNDCITIQSDSIRHEVRWRNRTAIDASRPIKIRFHLKNADLYSFWFA